MTDGDENLAEFDQDVVQRRRTAKTLRTGDFPTPEYLFLFRKRFPCFVSEGEIHSIVFKMIRKGGSTIPAELPRECTVGERGDSNGTSADR